MQTLLVTLVNLFAIIEQNYWITFYQNLLLDFFFQITYAIFAITIKAAAFLSYVQYVPGIKCSVLQKQ